MSWLVSFCTLAGFVPNSLQYLVFLSYVALAALIYVLVVGIEEGHLLCQEVTINLF